MCDDSQKIHICEPRTGCEVDYSLSLAIRE